MYCSLQDGYEIGLCLQGSRVKNNDTLLPERWRQQTPPKHWYPCNKLHRSNIPEDCILHFSLRHFIQTRSAVRPFFYVAEIRDFTGGNAAGGWNWQTTSRNCIDLLFRQRQDIFLFYKTSRPNLGPTQLSSEGSFPGGKAAGS
jgi:hypothetical protein